MKRPAVEHDAPTRAPAPPLFGIEWIETEIEIEIEIEAVLPLTRPRD
jgi:hypothetical protein